MQRNVRLALIYVGIWECLASGTLVGCVSLKFMLLTQTQNPLIGGTNTKSCLNMSGAKI